MRAVRAVTLAVAANTALLLGCAGLNGSLINTNKPQPAASPTEPEAAGTPEGAGVSAKRIGGELGRAIENLTKVAKSPGEAVDAITADQERALGQAAALSIIEQSGGLVLEHGLVTYVNAVANHVGLEGTRTVLRKDGRPRLASRRFYVGVLADDSMNAYALPGGYILITRGLLENLSCESDLAWVLGHEISHIDNEDGLKALKAAARVKGFWKSFEYSDTAKAGTEAPAAGEASAENQSFFDTLVEKLVEIALRAGVGADDELKADRQGLEYAVRAGYDARGAKRVLDLLGANPTKRRRFRSHAEPAKRLELLTSHILEAPYGKLGVDRFDRGAIQRLEAAAAAAR